ncbi:DUF1829 domain-containing protein [Chryseobacterium sp.]|uniref:DUF1829 domain-containing protein n=1 Tax=Chryseobacterium sp. TaxID=1871047 RepID=UPI000ECF8509|nr:DUF1829 domain-containing protein [Chryseobacterium sp.]HCA06929.1 hypothetical protein [Chryseobacterium sp.]
MNWIDNKIEQYYQWLKDRTYSHKDENSDWFLINTPYFGAFNDGIDIYVKNEGTNVILSDDGETLNNLNLIGININSSKNRRDLLDSILLNYGLKLSGEDIIVQGSVDKFPILKHKLISAILEINDLHLLSKSNVSSIFKEDVQIYLDSINIVYTPDFIAKGHTGLEFNFDFQIAKRSEEIVLKSFNSVNKSNLSNFLFSWEDIKQTREKTTKKEFKAIAIINDSDKTVKDEYIDALKSKNADYILWSEKNSTDNIRKLVA